MAVLDVIEWRRFEALVEALFQQEGFATRSQSHGADGGVDVWLYEGRKAVALVQCKHWRGRAVGVDKLRELRGVMAAQRVSRGWLVTSGYFSSEARAFARDNQINALDGRSLLERIAQRSPAQQRQLLRVALLGDYWRPTCVNCGTKMQPQRPADGSRPLWHCLPCQHSLPMRSTG